MSELSYFYWGVYNGTQLVAFYPTSAQAAAHAEKLGGTIQAVKTAWR